MIAIDKQVRSNRLMNVHKFLEFLYTLDNDGYDIVYVIKQLKSNSYVEIDGIRYILSKDEVSELLKQAKEKWIVNI